MEDELSFCKGQDLSSTIDQAQANYKKYNALFPHNAKLEDFAFEVF